MAAVDLVTPGERVGDARRLRAGEGVYARGDSLIASLVGRREESEDGEVRVASGAAPPAVLAVGDVVLGRVERVLARSAHLAILCTEPAQGGDPVALPAERKGVVRRENVRAVDVDGVLMHESFRPGDVVRAAVISLGDSRQYFLSTAEPALGVVFAEGLEPASHCLMVNKETGAEEKRKVAATTSS